MSYEFRVCPRCNAEHASSIARCGCGYTWPASAAPANYTATASLDGCCEWISGGDRCHNPGAVKSDTLGSGPWLCVQHSDCHDMRAGREIVMDSHRDISRPDYSLEGRRRASLAAAEVEVPGSMRGWTRVEYRANLLRMVNGIGHGAGKSCPDKILAKAQAGIDPGHYPRQYAAAALRRMGRPQDADYLEHRP